MEIKTTEQYVLAVLKRNVRARQDDFILYGGVLKEMGIDLNMSLAVYLATAKQKKLPTFETVTRCRRHIQELEPKLKDFEVTMQRQNRIEDFKEYNLSSIGE